MSDKFNRGFVDDKGNSVKDSAYDLIHCIMTNVDGDQRDIRNMVGNITITENIFSPSLVCQLGIRDESNFLEEFNITGSESLEIKIITKSVGIERELDFLFYVQQYDDYARSGSDNQVQAYTLIAVSEHGFIAPLKTITRSVNKSNTAIIKDIYENDLGVKKFKIEGTPSSNFRGIIPLSNPIVAAGNILKVTACDKNTPFLLFEDLSGTVRLASLRELNNRETNPVFKTFINTQTIKNASGGSTQHFERSRQMTKVISNIGLAPSLQAKKGAFASNNVYVDIANKTVSEKIFNVNGAEDQLNPEYTTSKKGSRTRGNLPEKIRDRIELVETLAPANTVYHYINPNSFNTRDREKTMGEQEMEQAYISRAYISAYDACSHKFTVMGDTFLNPGRTIELKFPKATDPIAYKKYTGKSDTDFFDKTLSGDYMIFTSVHSFINGVHSTTIVAKTDSI